MPGLVLASLWSDSCAVFLDANGRKADLLEEAVRSCGWQDRVAVIRLRAEIAGRDPRLRESFDTVVARSFSSPPTTAECASPFLQVGGTLVVSEPPPAASEGMQSAEPPPAEGREEETDRSRWPVEPMMELGLEPLVRWRRRFGFQVMLKCSHCPQRFPRREGVPEHRPLWRVPSAPREPKR